jgi:hypothetical protein
MGERLCHGWWLIPAAIGGAVAWAVIIWAVL